ncbi:hypothetical protein ACEPAH_3932 [Sanghuangporus vaninii]
MSSTANIGLGEPMDVDKLRREPSQESNDLYLSDSDTEFADAESEIFVVPLPVDGQDRNGSGHDVSEEGSSSFDLVEPSSSAQSSSFGTTQETHSLPSDLPGGQSHPASQHDEGPNFPNGQTTQGDDNLNRKRSLDLVENIKGLFRILDLISEQGSGGLVDKVIIDQESTGRFINEMRPGTYKDLTKVDFKALDEVDVKPVGVYGSKSEIVRLLGEQGVLNDETTRFLLMPQTEDSWSGSPCLRAGLYALIVPGNVTRERQVFVIFWPEETTWDDNAISSVRRNRITFIRYLTKIADQIVALVSEEHGRALVWDDPDDPDDNNSSFVDLEEDTDRLFAFEVSKASEQEENVSIYEGIKIKNSLIGNDTISTKSDAAGKPDSQNETYLVSGDTRQALLTSEFIPGRDVSRRFNESFTNSFQVKTYLFDKDCSLRLGPDISRDAIALLIQNGLTERYPVPVSEFKSRERGIEEHSKRERQLKTENIKQVIEATEPELSAALETYLVNLVLNSYPKLDEASLRSGSRHQEGIQGHSDAVLKNLFVLYPDLQQKFDELAPPGNFTTIKSEGRTFTKAMRKVVICDHLFSHNELSVNEQKIVWSLVESGVESGDLKGAERYLKDEDAGVFSSIVHGVSKFGRSIWTASAFPTQHNGPVKEALEASRNTKSFEFFDKADGILQRWPLLETGIREVFNVANAHFADNIANALKVIPHRLIYEQIKRCKDALERELGRSLHQEQERSRSRLLADIEHMRSTEGSRPRTITLEELEKEASYRYFYERYRASGRISAQTEPSVRYSVHPLELTEEDKHRLRMDSTFNPRPKVSEQGTFRFSLPIGTYIRLIRLLPNDQCLIVAEGSDRDLFVYIGNASTLDSAISGKRTAKIIKREKTGQDILLAYEEGKHTLVICGVDVQKPLVQVYYFVFDEKYQTLSAQGSAINLTAWYASDLPRITDVLVVNSGDELALVEDSGKVRIFSNVTQQFRPAHLQLPSTPITTFATPDGACFGAIYLRDSETIMAMYHWASLGSHEGFTFKVADSFSLRPLVSAFDDRKNVHLFTLDSSSATCVSIRISIIRPVTEFHFREKHNQSSFGQGERRTIHNSLVDCHSDVWTRFPVVPAVQRQTIVSRERRKPRSMRFVTAWQTRVPFRDYFKDMIQKFEKSTKKPTGSLLSDIIISTCDFASDLDLDAVWQDTSVFKAGEWVVDIFCLIPIHIAIARDNRFIPLKDGVWAPEVEKSLLGADVGRVADSLSFGWYESIFQSYMSTKNVKVVSSMGEQSVGKSFALNHLADTSFAGSAMRTTEGVWMAVTPTETDLIVALDFEGVHSIERSAQEDTLLVLFNAAISNLVLFRNNFALSRDITNLFQSFQSSSTVLDPEANRSLFQSTLVIIIKDVVDSDRIEIAKEFKLKLHKIVQEEQGANFITRLYRGRLDIIPWPVIESRQFYTLFTTLKKRLDGQGSTHEGGGAFLHKLKMLMAKLKTNDWGSLSQNMATHRAQHLLSLLPRAMSFGATELEPDVEPLKNFDTNLVIECDDSNATFWINQSDRPQAEQKTAVRSLMRMWPDFMKRHEEVETEWMEKLCLYLQQLVDRRIAHVEAWIDSNLSRFNSNSAAIEELRRALDTKTVEIKRSVHLCKTKCTHCHLLCVGVQFHEDIHDCSTNHLCPSSCQFVDEHDDEEDPCSLPAGHEGPHMCDPAAHLCGYRCDLNERKGCVGSCTKVAGHPEAGHICSARRHLCGEPCELRDVSVPGGKLYSCQGTCSAAWDEEHDSHLCGATSCPITCQLCKRLCASANHLHGLHADAVHLCGQEHKCKEECASDGVCEIDTVPQSIEATFNGAHDRFQYTKYSQKTKRLPCAIPIGPGLLTHDGPHIHSTSARIFHFCDARCSNCDYVCTLPYQHPQPEHSTNHGSMSRTSWVVDGSSLELDGHKFGSNDDGAPMLCNLVCSAMGRHAHIDYCRASDPNSCNAPEVDHIRTRIDPNPDRPKDWISHGLYWRRLGFRDPYSREEQATFAKCDAMCSGPEHQETATNAAQPSYCTLPIFHPRAVLSQAPAGGHVSDDGHAFSCKNPAVLTQAFHVIFAIDRSGSMSIQDRRPVPTYPASTRIMRTANNRLGSVYYALHSFWSARATAMNQAGVQTRRDAYSAILFNGSATEVYTNDFSSTPDNLLDSILRYSADGGTNFSAAIHMAEEIMTRHWSTERAPVVIFLSDGECSIGDDVVYSLCRKAVGLGRALSFQAVSFGPDGSSTWLRRMVQIAKEVQDRAPRDPLLPANAVVESSYSIALDSVRLAETFLGIAESLRKTRGGLIR